MKNYPWRRFAAMIFGLFLLGTGVAVFKISGFGNDPSSAFNMALGNRLSMSFGTVLLFFNLVCFIAEILFGRRMIGAGTFANWFLVGYVTDLVVWCLTRFSLPEAFVPRLGVLIIGVLVLSLGCSIYQTADLGIAPYDCLSLLMAEKTPIPYFWCRITTDSVCAVLAFAFGGLVGLGTLICAVGLGPFISFFSKTAAKKICGMK